VQQDYRTGTDQLTAPSAAIVNRRSEEMVVQVGAPPRFFSGWLADYRGIWSYRELLLQLVRKELKVKYKGSVLGFLWTLARPTFQIAIYYLAFTVFLGNQQPAYAIFIFTGLIAWTLFTDIVGGCTGVIVGNGPLINKTAFPREILPLSVAGASIVNFVAQLPVLGAALVISALTGHVWTWTSAMFLLPLAVLVAVVLGSAVGIFLAAVTVYLRDVQHLIEIVMLAWFWITPVVYPASLPVKNLSESHPLLLQIYLANPMVMVVSAFQRAFYTMGPEYLYGGNIALRLVICLIVSVVLLWLAQRVFAKLSANFAQEL
jgi:ABC-2 type transport system permease protein